MAEHAASFFIFFGWVLAEQFPRTVEKVPCVPQNPATPLPEPSWAGKPPPLKSTHKRGLFYFMLLAVLSTLSLFFFLTHHEGLPEGASGRAAAAAAAGQQPPFRLTGQALVCQHIFAYVYFSLLHTNTRTQSTRTDAHMHMHASTHM